MIGHMMLSLSSTAACKMGTELVVLAHPRNSRSKGHHVFKSSSGTGDTFMCEREHANRHSAMAIAVKKGAQTVGHVPERLARILTPMLEDGRLIKIDGWITGPERPAPEGVWRTGGGIELPCCYVLHGTKEDRKGVRECLHCYSRKRKLSKTDP